MTAVTAVVSKSQIVQSIRAASRATGIDFDYLLATAERESSLNPQAKSTTSSASGLFQFLDRTWLDLVHRHGEQIGLGSLAREIKLSDSGRPTVADGQIKQEILALRHDPEVSAFMAGKMASESKSILERTLNRPLTDSDLYLSHFFGARGAARFIQHAEQAPHDSAAVKFPAQARANKSVFYNADGTSKSFAEVRAHLVNRHDETAVAGPADTKPTNIHHALFTDLRPTISPVAPTHLPSRSNSAAAVLRGSLRPASQGHFILSPQVVQALNDLRMPSIPDPSEEKSDDTRRNDFG